jgi:hypothetical protein
MDGSDALERKHKNHPGGAWTPPIHDFLVCLSAGYFSGLARRADVLLSFFVFLSPPSFLQRLIVVNNRPDQPG